MVKTLTENSEYIRRDYTNTQEVSTPLNFIGDITCKDATALNNPITFKQAKDLKDEAIEQVLEDINNANLQLVKRFDLDFNLSLSINPSNLSQITNINTNGGIGQIGLITFEGWFATPIGWSLGEGYNSVNTSTSQNSCYILGEKQIYFAPNLKEANTPIFERNRMNFPLTESDKEYLAGYDDVFCVNVKTIERNFNYLDLTNASVWGYPLNAFKLFRQKSLGTATRQDIGYLLNTSSNATGVFGFYIQEDEIDSLNNFINNIKGMCFGLSQNYNNTFYGSSYYEVRVSENKKEIFNIGVGNFTTTKKRCYVNLVMDETYNTPDLATDMAQIISFASYYNEGFPFSIKYNNATNAWELESN